MQVERRPSVVLVWALVVLFAVSQLWPLAISAAPAPRELEAGLIQPPPPEPPAEPPPGSGWEDGPEPYQPPEGPLPEEGEADPYLPPAPEPATEETESVPGMPASPPDLPALPDPSSVDGGADADGSAEPSEDLVPDAMGPVYAIAAPGFDFGVLVDRGCGATYREGESIQFSVSAEWPVLDPTQDYWRYLEVWGSTNGAWWHQVIRGQWIEPKDSIVRNSYVARPVGDELLYARLLDRWGNVLDEATCEFTSEEEFAPPVGDWIGCDEVQEAYVEAGTEHAWSFFGQTGQRITISLYGVSGFDTYLELLDPSGRLMRENDDISRSNRNSRIRMNLPRSGTYTIVAHGYNYHGGSYHLYVSCH